MGRLFEFLDNAERVWLDWALGHDEAGKNQIALGLFSGVVKHLDLGHFWHLLVGKGENSGAILNILQVGCRVVFRHIFHVLDKHFRRAFGEDAD